MLFMFDKFKKDDNHDGCCDLCARLGKNCPESGCRTANIRLRAGLRTERYCEQGDSGKCTCGCFAAKPLEQIAEEMGVSTGELAAWLL